MNTREAIEILKIYKHPNPKDDFVYKENQELDDIINLLQQGKKYRQMWEELEGFFESKDNKDLLHMNCEDFVLTISEIGRSVNK